MPFEKIKSEQGTSDEPVDLLKVRHDLGQTIMLGNPHPDECLEIYKQLGPSRSFPKIQQYLKNQGRKSPAITTLKNWSRKLKWAFHAREYDLEIARRVDENRKAELAKEAQEDLSDLAGKMRQVAHKALAKLKVKLEHLSIKSGGEFKAVAEAAVALNKAAEVLSGGVSDRTETVRTVEERKSDAMKIVDEAFQRVKAGDGNDNKPSRHGLNQHADYVGRSQAPYSDGTGAKDRKPVEEVDYGLDAPTGTDGI